LGRMDVKKKIVYQEKGKKKTRRTVREEGSPEERIYGPSERGSRRRTKKGPAKGKGAGRKKKIKRKTSEKTPREKRKREPVTKKKELTKGTLIRAGFTCSQKKKGNSKKRATVKGRKEKKQPKQGKKL